MPMQQKRRRHKKKKTSKAKNAASPKDLYGSAQIDLKVRSDRICATMLRVFAKNIIAIYSGGSASIWSLAATLKELGIDSLLNRNGCKRQEREQMRDGGFALKVGSLNNRKWHSFAQPQRVLASWVNRSRASRTVPTLDFPSWTDGFRFYLEILEFLGFKKNRTGS